MNIHPNTVVLYNPIYRMSERALGAALELLEQGEPLEKIMLKRGWQTDSTAIKYLRNWIY